MKKVVLILLTMSVALGAVTLHLVSELRRERAAGLQLQARIAELERSRAPRSTLSTALERSAPAPSAAPAPILPSTANAASARTSAVRLLPSEASKEERMALMRGHMERQRALLRDPEYREAMRLQQRAMLPSIYPDLAAELSLTTEETEELMSLLADQQVREMERDRPIFAGQPDPAAMQELARKQQEQQQATDEEIRTLLGEDKWREWNDYKATMGVRHEVAQLRTTLATNGAPLEDYQVKPLQRALLEAQQRQVQEWSRSAVQTPVALDDGNVAKQQLAWQEEALRRQREHQEHLRDALKTVLTDAQLRHIEQQHDAQLKLQEAHLRMMRVQAEAEASGQIAPSGDVALASEAATVTNGALFVQPPQ